MFKSIIGHRGDRFYCPENTIPAFQHALELGADGIECDLRLSKDNVGVIVHDKDLNRAAGQNLLVHELTLDELKQFDFGHWKDEKWAGTRIPTLDETLSILPAGKVIHLEIKAGDEALDSVDEALNKAGLNPNQIILTGFSYEIAAAAKKRFPKTPFLINGLKFDFSQVVDTGADGIATFYNEEIVRQAQEAGLIVRVGAVNTYEEALKVKNAGVEIIDSDHLEQLLGSMKR